MIIERTSKVTSYMHVIYHLCISADESFAVLDYKESVKSLRELLYLIYYEF